MTKPIIPLYRKHLVDVTVWGSAIEFDVDDYHIFIDIQCLGKMVRLWKERNPKMNFASYENISD